MPRPAIYLAGPDVFAPNAAEIGARKKRLCAEYGLLGLFPLDNEITEGGADAAIDTRIFRGNLAMMRQAEAGVFNLTPFRGVGADVGTAYELGLMFALGKPVFAYSNCPEDLQARVTAHFGAERDSNQIWRDKDGLMIESFGNCDNLMLDACLREQGRAIIRRTAPPELCFDELSGFIACLEQARELLHSS